MRAVDATLSDGIDAASVLELCERTKHRVSPLKLQYLRVGSTCAAVSFWNTDSSVTMRFGIGLPATTSLTAAMSCGPNNGLHSTVTLSLPAIMASNAPFTPSMEMM